MTMQTKTYALEPTATKSRDAARRDIMRATETDNEADVIPYLIRATRHHMQAAHLVRDQSLSECLLTVLEHLNRCQTNTDKMTPNMKRYALSNAGRVALNQLLAGINDATDR